MSSSAQVFAKAHGTENDFIILPDPEVNLSLAPKAVAALCDRRAGIGADGVLRVARAGTLQSAGVLAELPEGVEADDWFMDYRNADGSIAEMCGNGVRVFAHWVHSRGLVESDTFTVGTRAGAREVKIHQADEVDAMVSVDMGQPRILGSSFCTLAGQNFTGLGVDMGNPHLACVVPRLTPKKLAELPVEQEFSFDEQFFPEGVNIEIVTPIPQRPSPQLRVHMRVHERGSGETRSCGTGTVAAAQAALLEAGAKEGEVTVVVPGGEIKVQITEHSSTLTGPSKIVAEGTLNA